MYISLYNFVLCNLAVYFILLLKNKPDLTWRSLQCITHQVSHTHQVWSFMKIRWPWKKSFLMVEHPKLGGHVTPNEDEFQKPFRTKFRYYVWISEFTVSLLIIRILAEEKNFEIGNFHFWTSVTLTLTLVRHMKYRRTALIETSTCQVYIQNFSEIRQTFGVNLSYNS